VVAVSGPVETARLVGLSPRPSAFGDLRALHGDPQVMRTLAADGRPASPARTAELLRRIELHWALFGFGVRFFRHRTDGRFVGYCGLRHGTVEGEPIVELLYAVASPQWRQGYASEMAGGLLAEGDGPLGLKSTVAFTLPHNRGSRRTMEKSGFAYERDIVHAGLPHVLYRRRAAAAAGLSPAPP